MPPNLHCALYYLHCALYYWRAHGNDTHCIMIGMAQQDPMQNRIGPVKLKAEESYYTPHCDALLLAGILIIGGSIFKWSGEKKFWTTWMQYTIL